MNSNTQSHTHRRKIRNLTRLVKSLHPLVAKIPAPLPTLNSEANRISPKLSAKDATARKEVFGKKDARHLDKAAISYWLKSPDDQPYGKSNRS